MNEPPPAAAEDPEDEVTALVRKLHETQQRLQELAGGEVDAVLHPGGQSYLLHEAQEKLRRSEAAQRDSAATQASILDALPAHVALLDEDGVVLSVNDRWRHYAGSNALNNSSSGVGLNYLEICARAHGDCAEEAHAAATGIRTVLTGTAQNFSLEYPCHSPTEQRWFQLMVSPLKQNGPGGAVVMHVDITERMRTERALRESEEYFRFLHDLAEATRSLAEPAQIMAVTARMLGGRLRASRCAYADVEEDGVTFAILHDYTDGCPSLVGRYDLALFGARTVATLQSGQTLIFRSVAAELLPEEGAESFNAVGVQAVICCPLIKQGVLRAKMSVHQTTARDWKASEIALVEEVVERCWAMVERRTAENNLRQSEALLRIASRTARLGGWSVDLPAVRINWSEEVCAIHEVPLGTVPDLEQAIGFYAPQSRETFSQAFAACAEQGTPFDLELEIITAQERPVWVRAIGEAQRDGTGTITRVQGALQDIAERKQAEEEVAFNEQRYRSLVEATTAIVWDAPASGEMLGDQRSWAAFTGQSVEEYRGSGWLQAIHPDDQAETAHAWAAAVASRTIYAVEHRLRARDHTYRDMLVRGVPIMGEDGNIRQWIGVHTDITERKRSEKRIAEQAALIDEARDAIVVCDLEHRIAFWSKGAERLYGWTADEVRGDLLYKLLLMDRVRYQEADRAVHESGAWNGEMEKIARDGSVLILDSRWTLVHDHAGLPRSILSINTDITERKKIEQQFLRAQRMESIGTLAGGIAHDLNNCLSPIILSLELLTEKFTDPDSRELLDIVSTSARRGSEMVRQVLTFGRGVEGDRQDVQIRHLICDIEKIVTDTFLKHIQIRTRIPDDLWTVVGDATQLHQVLLNLCVNARDAMPDGGALTISAENLTIDAQYAGMNPEAHPGAYVFLQVEDNGSGMPPGIIEKIFDPFFTTKEIGKGTGLGLSTSLAIVKSHGGFVRVYSEPGKGTTFKVYLPAETKTSSGETAKPTVELPRGHGEIILVVDDEPSVRLVTQQTLGAFGYRVILAADGAEAVATYATRGAEIAVVLTDMMMPVMDGLATIQVLRKLNPKLPVIAASGLSANEYAAKFASLDVQQFLSKPYTAETLLKVLKQVLSTAA